jgi:MFS family permease
LMVPVLPLFVLSFGVSYGVVGLVLAADGVGTLLCDVPAGALLRRLGHKRVMLLGLTCITVGVLALIWAQSLIEVIACRLVTGAGMALWTISRLTYIADAVDTAHRGRALAVLGGISRIGGFLGPALGGFIAALYDLRAPFLVYACLGGVGLLATAWGMKGGKVDGPSGAPSGGHGALLGSVLKSHYRVLLTAGSGQLFASMIRSTRRIVVPLYGAEVLGLDVEAVGLVLSIASAVDMSLFYPAGFIMDRFGRKFNTVPAFAIQGIGMALIPLMGSFAGLLAATIVVAIGNGLSSGSMMTLGTDLAPEEARGEFLGFWRLIGDSGHAASPLIVGNLADLFGLGLGAVAAGGMGVMAAAVLWAWVPETLVKNK